MTFEAMEAMGAAAAEPTFAPMAAAMAAACEAASAAEAARCPLPMAGSTASLGWELLLANRQAAKGTRRNDAHGPCQQTGAAAAGPLGTPVPPDVDLLQPIGCYQTGEWRGRDSNQLESKLNVNSAIFQQALTAITRQDCINWIATTANPKWHTRS